VTLNVDRNRKRLSTIIEERRGDDIDNFSIVTIAAKNKEALIERSIVKRKKTL